MSKNILIVGANSFIAKGITPFLEKDGYILQITTREQLNIENEKSIIEFVSSLNGKTFDGIIFCQGINPSQNAKESTLEHILQMLTVNIAGPILLLKHIHTFLNKEASVIFFSSVAATKGSYDPSYASAKSAIHGLIQSLSNEFMELRFNAVALALVQDSPVYHQMTPEFREKHRQRMEGGKLITIDQIQATIIGILSNTNINRSIIPITGGYTF